jgi:hypothetical protein
VIGLIFFSVLGLYLWLCYYLTKLAKTQAKRKGINPWFYGIPAAILSYGILFWDWMPTFATHQYLCMTEGGFTVNKTVEQWKEENPGIAEMLEPIEHSKWQHEGNITRVPLNQRFIWEFEDSQHWFGIHGRDERIVDTQTDDVLARYVDFDSDIPNMVGAQESLRDYKGWLTWGTKSCEWGDRKRTRPLKFQFNKFMYLMQNQKEYE